MLRFVIARTEACPNQRNVMSLPHSAVSPENRVASVLRSPKQLTRETLVHSSRRAHGWRNSDSVWRAGHGKADALYSPVGHDRVC